MCDAYVAVTWIEPGPSKSLLSIPSSHEPVDDAEGFHVSRCRCTEPVTGDYKIEAGRPFCLESPVPSIKSNGFSLALS